MKLDEDFDEIVNYTHWRNWYADWDILRNIYKAYPDSYSVLTPFAYAYLEEIIRSTTSEYGMEVFDESGKPKKRKVGIKLIKLAIEENIKTKPEYAAALEDIKRYFLPSQKSDRGENRNSVVHGYMHSGYWNRESFEKLVHDIALISKYAGF
ncbi:hypothetical protein SAMN05216357_11082 [Porphyromonadaceae bacterium KH3CP3RA]|nr:hypothetical protein SAMN05216357_11082 [Porphyromonadaceae bacterium KH3CP3RA]